MSTILEGQVIGWKGSRARDRAPSAARVSRHGLLRSLIVVVSVVAAIVYFATRSQTVALVSGLIRDAQAARTPAARTAEERPSPVVVFVRPTAREGAPLLP